MLPLILQIQRRNALWRVVAARYESQKLHFFSTHFFPLCVHGREKGNLIDGFKFSKPEKRTKKKMGKIGAIFKIASPGSAYAAAAAAARRAEHNHVKNHF